MLLQPVKLINFIIILICVVSFVYHVILQHSSTPDIIVRLSFEMTLMSFVCNFGGLLGMWLGFNILSISKEIFKSIRLLYRFDRNQNNSFNNCIFQQFNNINLNNKSNSPSNKNNLPLVEIDL